MPVTLAFRALAPADASRPDGSQIVLRSDVGAALDSRVPTDDFSSTELVMLLTESARPEGVDVVVPAGTRLRVHAHRSYAHHLASAVDVEVTVLQLVEPGVPDPEGEFARAMLMLAMATASGPSGRGAESGSFTGPLPA